MRSLRLRLFETVQINNDVNSRKLKKHLCLLNYIWSLDRESDVIN